MNYAELKKQTSMGWNTWYSQSMTAHVLLPDGFGINLSFKNFAESGIISNLKVGDHGMRPGSRSWNGAYTSLTFKLCGLDIYVESAACNGEQYIMITPSTPPAGTKIFRAPAVIVEAMLLWGKGGTLFSRNGCIGASLPDGKTIEIFTSGKRDQYVYPDARLPYFAVTLDVPVVISTVPCAADDARNIIDSAKKAIRAEETSYGVNIGAYQAMRSCMAWDTIYEPEHDRVCSPVSRSWSEGWGGYVLFCWDTYFAALMSRFGGRELAYLNALAITDECTEEGFIPNFGSSNNCKSRDRSQPPVGSMVCLRLWETFGDDWFIKEIFPALYRWNCWYWEKRRLPDGTFAWGSESFEPRCGRYFELHDTGNVQGARFESGLDNSPMYDNAGYDDATHLMQLSDVGLTGLYIEDCRCLIKLAGIAERSDVIPILKARLDASEAAMTTLWNADTGIFENRVYPSGEFSHRLSPTNLYSLYSHAVTDAQKASVSAKYLMNPDELGGEFMLPSISRSDTAFPDQDYWRGRIWAPMNYLVYEALCEAEMEPEKKALAESSRALLLKEWEAHGHVHENYNGSDGWGCDKPNSNNFYHWGGLLGYVAIVYEGEKSDKSL